MEGFIERIRGKPSVPFGFYFRCFVKGNGYLPNNKTKQSARMADFVVWGSAIAQALGFKVEDFTAAYQMNIEAQNSEVINCNTLAQAVLAFMADKDLWNGTVREAFEELGKLVTVSKEDKSFPKHSNKLRGASQSNQTQPARLWHQISDSGLRCGTQGLSYVFPKSSQSILVILVYPESQYRCGTQGRG